MSLLAIMLVATTCFAASKTSTDNGYLGNDDWIVQADGDIIPIGTSDIGSSADPVDDIYATGISVNTFNYGLDESLTQDAFLITLDPALASYSTGTQVSFVAEYANTGACTINVNNLGEKDVKMLHDQDPAANYVEDGSVVVMVYDGTNFQLISPDANP